MLIFTAELVAQCVEEVTEVSFGDICGKSRKADVVKARWITSYCLRKYVKKMNYTKIGFLLNRDHTTIMYHLVEMEDRLKQDKEFRQDLADVEAMLYKHPADKKT